MRTGSTQHRRASASQMLEKKRARLQQLVEEVAEGTHLTGVYPVNMRQFRLWSDQDHALTVTSPKLVNARISPHNADVIARISTLLDALAAYKTTLRDTPQKRLSVSEQLRRVTAERDDALYQVGRLLSQVQMLMYDNHRLQTSATDAEKGRTLANRTVGALANQVVRLGGSTVRPVK